MKYKLKNGSEITTIDTTDASRSKVKYVKARNEEMRDFYHRYPDKFVEDMCGIKLKLYQKIWLRIMNCRKEILNMLLQNEVRLGEIYVEDKDFFVGEQLPVNLFQLIEMPTTKCTYGLYGDKIDTLTNPIWENIATGELVNWGTHCFSTIDRIKTQYKNIDKVHDEKRKKYLQQAIKLINA